MVDFLHRIRGRIGDLWWYSILIFIACRSGDAVQAFIGLWLVPHYVPQNELGAALPLLQIGSAIGLPLSILVIPFTRWLTLYASRGEYGKVKRLLSLSFRSVAVAFVLAVVMARFVFPLFFERMRIEEGALGVLIICAGLVGPFSNVFGSALQGLKRFKTIALINAVGAPVRLVVMLVTMPFRALSGYMAGQISSPALCIVISWFSLRKALGRNVKAVSLGRDEVREMLRYTAPVAMNAIVATIFGTWQALLIRQRLPEVESAGFYIISRLAEVATYAGLSLSVVVFPLSAEAREKGESGNLLLGHLLCGTLLPGIALMLFFAFCGRWLLDLVPLWRDYAGYAPLLTVYTLRLSLTATLGAFSTFEFAAGRFSFLWYWIPISVIDTGVLGVLTGYGAFIGILPQSVVDWMASISAARIDFFVWWLSACTLVQTVIMACHVLCRAHMARRKGAADVP